MRLIVTGSVGFIGSALVEKLLCEGNEVCGIDNHNNYYDPAIKAARLARLARFPSYQHFRIDLCNKSAITEIFETYKPRVVINLAAQAGVRYSIENPHVYIESNIVGFVNVLEACRIVNVDHMVYASSSSVYGANAAMPFSEHDNVNHPLSLYAATKRSNELMAHAYSHLHALPTTGLRFFTVYGPWGRPDMALFKFTKAIISGDEIQVFNNGLHRRDFTYIDDVTEGIKRVIESPPLGCTNWDARNPDSATSNGPWKIYNIGSSNPTNLMDYIEAIERALGKQANVVFLPLQPGDVAETHADTSEFARRFDFQPATPVEEGINKFVEWYLEYFGGTSK